MRVTKSTLWTTVAFTIVGVLNLILFAVLANLGIVATRDKAFLSYIFAVGYIALVWLPFLFSALTKIHFSTTFLIVFDVYLFFSVCLGSLWHGFFFINFYDKILHTVGGFMFAYLIYEIFAKCKNQHLNLAWMFVLVLSFSMLCGGVWEIYEYTTDGIFNNNAQVYQGLVGHEALTDTMLDLVCDLVGAIVGGVVAVLIEWKKNKKLSVGEILAKENEIEVKKTEI